MISLDFKKYEDTFWHTVLGVILCEIFWLSLFGLPDAPRAKFVMAIMVCGSLVWREVTQKQTKDYGSDFRKGWDFRTWSFWKNVETWVPVFITMSWAFWRIYGG